MRPFHVLLVDDSEADIYLHKLVIREMGFADGVTSIGHGRAALDHLHSISEEEGFPRLILLDINMPVMDGWEFLDVFESEFGPVFDAVVVTMLSTSMDPRDVERSGTYASVASYMPKPLKAPILAEFLQQHFPELEY